MQTYLPFPEIAYNSAILTEVDLGQQIRSGLAILSTLSGDLDWRWHPAVEMWDGYTDLLAKSILKMLNEWKGQGFRDTFQAVERLSDMGFNTRTLPYATEQTPWWWGDRQFHRAQKAALIRHNTDWYAPFFKGKVDPTLPEMWPRTDGVYEVAELLSGNKSWFTNGRPMFIESNKMSDDEFVLHANEFHRLLGPKRKISKRDISVFGMLRALHDRFHSMKFYDAHDHIR